MKATQGGYTEIEIIRSLWGMIHGKYKQGVLYMFPTTDDVNEFSKHRFNPILLNNHLTIGKYVKNTDTASLKKIHDAFLFLRGARLSQRLQADQKESTKLRSIPVDVVKFDEVDLMDEDAIEKARGRMGHSLVKEEVFISNPTLPGFGIDRIFNTSDQRYWFRKCTCGTWTCAEKSFPECIKIRSDGTGYIGCDKCGKEVFIKDGKWVPDKPENSNYMHGYRWSQLTSIYNDPAEILADYINPPEGNLGDIVRLRLGLPYAAAEDQLLEPQVLARCGGNPQVFSHKGPCAMGVDVGKTKHIVIGVRTGKELFTILRTAQVKEWSDIHNIARRFNVRSAVIDIRPYEDKAREFQKAENYKIFLCEYKENTPQGTIYNPKTGIVSVNRTEICDATHRLVTDEGCLILPAVSPEMKEFARQMCTMAKFEEKNKRTGIPVYRYRTKSGAPDHFRHALNYFYLAASTGRIASVSSRKKRLSHAISE
jgi:hypothetical protein